MCRILVYRGVKTEIANIIYRGERSFVSQSKQAYKAVSIVNADGFGLGWYDDKKEPAIYRDVLPAWADTNLKNLSKYISAELLFAHDLEKSPIEAIRNVLQKCR